MSDNFLKIVKVQNSDGTYSDQINIVTDGDYVTCYNGNDLNTNLRNIFSTVSGNMTNTSDIKDNIITFTSADASSPSNFLSVDVFTTGSKSSVLFNNISKMSSNIRFLNSNKLDKTGDAKSNTVTFISDDTSQPSNFLSMNVLSSGSTIASLFNSMSKMASNIRFLNNNRVDNRYITKSNDGILVHDLPNDNSNGIKIFTDGSINVANSITSNKDLNLILPVGDSSGSIKLVIDGTSNDGILTSCRIKNTLQDGALLLNNTGAFGLYSYTNSKWILYMNPNGDISCPNTFASSLKTTGAIGTGGKTAWNDTNKGCWLTSNGNIHLMDSATSGGGIGFHYNFSASATSILHEPKSGVLACTGHFATGSKTTWNDTSHAGVWLANDGVIHLSQDATHGGAIGFHYNFSANSTSSITETESGVLTCSGDFVAKSIKTTTITDIITVNSTNATIVDAQFVRYGKVAQVQINWANKNAISVPISGDITNNVTIGTMVAGKIPSIFTVAHSFGDAEGGMSSYTIDNNGGAIVLRACKSTGAARTIAANSTFRIMATYILP